MTHKACIRTWTIGLGLAGLLAGCGGPSEQAAPLPTTGAPQAAAASGTAAAETGPYAAGKKVFATSGCTRCHSGAGGAGAEGSSGGEKRGRNRGPNLATVGRESMHTVEWLSQQIRNPKAHKADSRMPPSDQGKISDNDLRALAEYLASLK